MFLWVVVRNVCRYPRTPAQAPQGHLDHLMDAQIQQKFSQQREHAMGHGAWGYSIFSPRCMLYAMTPTATTAHTARHVDRVPSEIRK